MTTDYIIIAIGCILSLSIFFITWKIYAKSSRIKQRIKYADFEKRQDIIIKAFAEHFEVSLMNKMSFSKDEKFELNNLFQTEFQKQLPSENLSSSIQLKHIPVLLETIELIYFENAVLDSLKEINRDAFIKETTTLYVILIKFVIFSYYLRRKEKQLDFDFDEQLFDISNYKLKLKLKKGDKGIEGITVDE